MHPFFRLVGCASPGGRTYAPVPYSDIGAVVETKAPPSMHRERCLRIPTKIHRKRRDCTKAVLLQCVSLSIASHTSLLTRPKRGDGYGCSPSNHAGNLLLHPLTGKTRRIIRNPTAHCKSRDNKNEIENTVRTKIFRLPCDLRIPATRICENTVRTNS